MGKLRTRILAGLTALGVAGGGLAVVAPQAVEATSFEAPDFPDQEFELLDLPANPSWLMLDSQTGQISYQNQTHVGLMHDELGPIGPDGVEAEHALSTEVLVDGATEDEGDAARMVDRGAPVLAAVGDLDSAPAAGELRSPELVTLGDDGILRLSHDLEDGLGLWATVDLSDHIPNHGGGNAIAVGFLDGRSASQNGVWVLTSIGRVILFRPSGSALDYADAVQVVPDGLSVFDGVGLSVMDVDVRPQLGVPEQQGLVGVLAGNTTGTAYIYVATLDPVGGDLIAAELRSQAFAGFPSGFGKGELKADGAGGVDFVFAGVMTSAADPRRAAMLTSRGHPNNDFCHASDPQRDPHVDVQIIPDGYFVSCAWIQDGIVFVDQFVSGPSGLVHKSEDGWTLPVSSPAGSFVIDDVQLDLPCEWLLVSPIGDSAAACSSGSRGVGGDTREWPPRTSTIVHVRNTAPAVDENFITSASTDLGGVSRGPNYSYGGSLGDNGRFTMVSLPALTNRVRIKLDDHTAPLVLQTMARPIAVLASPPYVAGAGQVPLAGPTYNKRETTGTGEAYTTSNSVSLSVGMDWGDSGGMFGVNASATVEREVGSETETSVEITGSEQYVGSPEEDTIIFEAPSFWSFPGEVVESSTGIGLHTRSQIDIPRANVISSATLSELQRQFPDLYTTGDGKGILDPILTHTAGDPGSYEAWGNFGEGDESTNVSSYCEDASFQDFPDVPTEHEGYPWGVREVDNPFSSPDLEEPDPVGRAVIASGLHKVQINTGTSEGAGVSITNSADNTVLTSNSLSAEVGGKAFYVTASAGAGHSWGRSWTQSFSDGVDFLGYVGHLPTSLPEETYDWHLFLCKKRTGIVRGFGNVPVWVLNYTVDNYFGSHGLEALAPIELTGPTHSAVVGTNPNVTRLDWTQESGTVKSYDVELEAIGVNEPPRVALNQFEKTSTLEAKARDLTVSTTLSELGLTNQLLPSQLYRWRVTARDLFDNEVTSEWEFFRTGGPVASASISLSDHAPSVGQPVTVTVQHENFGGPFSYTYDKGDGSAAGLNLQTNTFPITYQESGVYLLRVAVGNQYGSTITTLSVPVGPNAVDESYTAVEDTPLTKSAANGVMANDGGADLVRLETAPQNGTVSLGLDGAFTYTPEANYCGPDQFTYGVRGGAGVRYATTTLTVSCVNDAPTLPGPIDYTVDEDEVLSPSTPAGGVLAGVQDEDVTPQLIGANRTHSAEPVTIPSHGQLGINADGTFQYEPDADYCNSNTVGGYDTFQVRAVDRNKPAFDDNPMLRSSPPTTVRIKVTCVNDAPEVEDRSYSATEDEPRSVDAASGLKSGWSDVDTGATTGNDSGDLRPIFSPSSGTTNKGGTFAVDPDDGNFTYTPATNYCTKVGEDPDTFTYTATDSHNAAADPSATVSIDVACVNDAPVPVAKSYMMFEDGTLNTADTNPATGLLVGATDVDGDTLAVTIKTQPANGTLTPAAGGNFTYKPAPNYCSTQLVADSFTYEVSDGHPASESGVVGPLTATFGVLCENDTPVGVKDVYSAVDGQVLVIPAPGVLANDSDIDGDAITVVPRTGFTTGGPVQFFADGSVRFTPTAGFHGLANQTYNVVDSKGAQSAGVLIEFNVKARTVLTATKAVRKNLQATVKGTLKTVTGAPVPGAVVRFIMSNGNELCRQTTGADGVATCTGQVPANLTLFGRYEAVFDGNGEYLLSKSPSTGLGSLAGA